MAHMMYSQHHATMAPPQKPETFMLSSEAQQSLPQDAQVALQQVDNCKSSILTLITLADNSSEIFLNICSC
jgi:transcription factor STE12